MWCKMPNQSRGGQKTDWAIAENLRFWGASLPKQYKKSCWCILSHVKGSVDRTIARCQICKRTQHFCNLDSDRELLSFIAVFLYRHNPHRIQELKKGRVCKFYTVILPNVHSIWWEICDMGCSGNTSGWKMSFRVSFIRAHFFSFLSDPGVPGLFGRTKTNFWI